MIMCSPKNMMIRAGVLKPVALCAGRIAGILPSDDMWSYDDGSTFLDSAFSDQTDGFSKFYYCWSFPQEWFTFVSYRNAPMWTKYRRASKLHCRDLSCGRYKTFRDNVRACMSVGFSLPLVIYDENHQRHHRFCVIRTYSSILTVIPT